MEASGGREISTGGKREIEVGRVINETFRTYGDQLAPLLGSAAVIFVVAGVLQRLAFESGGILLSLVATAIAVAAQTLYTGFVVKLVEDVRDGRRDSSVGELFSSATGKVLPLIVNGILRGIAVAIGFILLIIPGLFLLTIWAVTAPAIVAEGKGPIGAFGRSFELVKGEGFSVFLVIVVAFLITFGIGLVFGAIGAAGGTALAVALSTLASIITAPIAALVASILFFDLGGGSVGGGEGAGSGSAPAVGY